MQVLQLYTQGTFFFYAALRQNKGLSCSSWWLDSMLSLWEWEALGLRETENLMSSLFEEGKIFQNVFQSSGEALLPLGRCSSSRWKNYNPCLQSSSPQRLPCPPSLWMHIFSHWLKWNHLPLCDSLDLFTDMAHTAMSPCRNWDAQREHSDLQLHNKLHEDKEYGQWICTDVPWSGAYKWPMNQA